MYRNERERNKMLNKFVIRAVLKNSDVWETVRYTEEGVTNVVENIRTDSDVVSHSVEKMVIGEGPTMYNVAEYGFSVSINS